MATDTLQIIIKSRATGTGAKDAEGALGGLKKAAGFAVAAFAAMKTAQAAVDFAKFGAGVTRQATALDNLAGAAGTSGDAIVRAIQGASDFTIDRMTAMSAANKALIMDVAQTPEQFERLTTVATALGRAMGMDAAKSIDDFVTAAARQSRMIADNLGLVVTQTDATEMYAKVLGKTADALTDAEKKQAFLNAMLVAGEAKMEALGTGSGDAASDFERLTAAMSDLKAMAAETIAVQTRGIVSAAADAAARAVQLQQVKRLEQEMIALGLLRDEEAYTTVEATRRLEAHTQAGVRTEAVFKDVNQAYEAYNEQLHAAQEGIAQATWELQDWETGSWAAEKSTLALTEAQREQAFALSATRAEMLELTEGSGEWIQSQADAQTAAATLAQEEMLLQAGLKAAAAEADVSTASLNGMAIMTRALAQAQVDAQTSTVALAYEEVLLQAGLQAAAQGADVNKASLEGMTEAAQIAAQTQMDLAQRLADATDAQIAQTAIDQLKQALDDGEISFEEYQKAVSETQLAFGLTTPESVAMSLGIVGLTGSLADSKLAADDYNEALALMITNIQAGTTAANALRAALREMSSPMSTEERMSLGLPAYQHGTPYHPGGFAWVGEGGPELVRLPAGSQVAPVVNNNQRSYNVRLGRGWNRQQVGSVLDNVGAGVAGRM